MECFIANSEPSTIVIEAAYCLNRRDLLLSHLKLLHKHQHLISTLVYIDCHLRAPNRPPCQYGIHRFSGTGCPSTGVLASTETYDRLFVLLSELHHILLVLFSAWMTYSASRSGPGGTVVPCIFGICVRLGVSPTTTEDPLQEILFWRWPDCFQPRAEQAKSHTAGTFKTLIVVCSSPLLRHLLHLLSHWQLLHYCTVQPKYRY